MGALPLVDEVEALLYRHVPVGIGFGDNPDEYRPEAESIVARVPRARSVDDVRTLVHGQFVRWFDEDTAGPADRYEVIARDVWATWLARSSGASWSGLPQPLRSTGTMWGWIRLTRVTTSGRRSARSAGPGGVSGEHPRHEQSRGPHMSR